MTSNEMLPKLFSAVHQAVIGTDGSTILFANPAAAEALGADVTGKPALELLPKELLENAADSFVCAASISGRQAAVTVMREGALTLLFLEFIGKNSTLPLLTRQIISSLRGNVMGLKMSADRCFLPLEEGQQPSEKHISMFYHYYYRLLRTATQADSADLLERGDLMFSPVSTDLVRLCGELTDTVSALCAPSGIVISFTTPESELVAAVDPERIEQLLLNLLSNSLRHTVSGCCITISLRKSGEKAVISVDDDGEGIPQERLSSIFSPPTGEPDLTRPEAGSGLGLYIAYGIAQLHKGVLLIESRQGEGTHVRLMLPLDELPAPKFSSPGTEYKRSVSSVLTGLADVLPNDCFGPRLED